VTTKQLNLPDMSDTRRHATRPRNEVYVTSERELIVMMIRELSEAMQLEETTAAMVGNC